MGDQFDSAERSVGPRLGGRVIASILSEPASFSPVRAVKEFVCQNLSEFQLTYQLVFEATGESTASIKVPPGATVRVPLPAGWQQVWNPITVGGFWDGITVKTQMIEEK